MELTDRMAQDWTSVRDRFGRRWTGHSQMYQSHEKNKKREYNDRVLNVEKATFTPLVFSTTGGMALEASQFL